MTRDEALRRIDELRAALEPFAKIGKNRLGSAAVSNGMLRQAMTAYDATSSAKVFRFDDATKTLVPHP
jgi:hypothetical protein